MADRALVPGSARRSLFRPGSMFGQLDSLHGSIDDLFDQMWGGELFPALTRKSEFIAPNVEVGETDEALEVTAELPGIAKEDVDVSVSDNVLTIKGEKREETDREEKDYHLKERSYGSFRRSFTLPANVDVDKTEAKTEDGVLRITIPKLPEAKETTKKISIDS